MFVTPLRLIDQTIDDLEALTEVLSDEVDTRVNAQTFVFVVEKNTDGSAVARQRAVQLGPIVGNDYVVFSGLKEGEQVVVGGVQKIGEGVPVQVTAS